jgi:DNA-binding NarL/FixJ family response regulator
VYHRDCCPLTNGCLIGLARCPDQERLFEAIKGGAVGYLLKNTASGRLIPMLRGVMRGEAAIGRAMAEVRKSSAGIRALLQDHIPAEDKALLAVADANLDERQDERVLAVFDTIEADLAWGFENLQEFYP